MISLGPDTLICIDSLSNFTLSVDTIFNSYTWQDGSSNTYFNVLDSGLYYISVSLGSGCYSSDSIYIQIDSCNINEISNIFTPNGDGLNDFFFIKNLEQFPNSKLEVFNRWGNLVYSDNNYQNDCYLWFIMCFDRAKFKLYSKSCL